MSTKEASELAEFRADVSNAETQIRIKTTLKRTYKNIDADEDTNESTQSFPSKIQRKGACYDSYRRIEVRHTSTSQQIAERGLIQDFKHDLHYVLTTLFDNKATLNLKSLSVNQLLKKSIAPEFRDFLRSQPTHLSKLFSVLFELSSSPVVSLSAACLFYFMGRDRKGIPLSEQGILLISSLLKYDHPISDDEEYAEHLNLVWSIMQDWLNYWLKKSNKMVKFDVTRENLSISHLAFEALAFISVKEQQKQFKSGLLNTGCLITVVAKLDKVVLELVNSVPPLKETSGRLKTVERCYRILENAAAFDQKNQTFLVQHRNSILIFSSAKFLNFSLKFIDDVNQTNSKKRNEQLQTDCSKIFDNICLLCRVLMNISHENENAALKIGQIAGFLGNCLQLLARQSNFAPKEKFFDLSVMMYGLMVNLLERCAANRRKFLQLRSDFLNMDGKMVKDLPSLNILAKLFIRHDSAAKIIDEELDNDLIADGQEEMGNGMEKAANMSQDEVVAAIQSMMSKASTHMEDSMIASYCSLAVAILVGTDQKLAEQVRELLPDKSLNPMLEQLERFLEFMRITKLKENTVNNIEQVLNSFQMASNSTD